MNRTVVIAIGNEYRGDDGIGPAVVADLAKDPPPGVDLARCDGEPAALLETWDKADLAIIVDAVLCQPSQPGRIWRSTVDNLTGVTSTASSHALGIPEALLLGRALDRMPRELVVIAVEAASLDLGLGLSAPVAAAVPEAVRAVLTELGCRDAAESIDHGPSGR